MQTGSRSTTPPILTSPPATAIELIESFDWSGTSVGPRDLWPESMKAVVSMLLRSDVAMVTLWGIDGVMIYNDAYAEFAAQRHPEVFGRNVREAWPEVADFNGNMMNVVLAGGTLKYRDQELILYRNGQPEQVWLNLDYSPLVAETGAVSGVMAIVSETTEKVRAERHIRSERERLGQMFEQAPGFMVMFRGPDHVFDMVNPAYLQLVGHRNLIGKPVREALPEIDGQGFFELLDKVYVTGEPFFGTALTVDLQRVPGGDAEKRFVDFVYQPLRNERGDVTGIFTQGVDVTERIEAEEQAREQQAQFFTFAQAMPNQVWAAQPDGLLDWLNDLVHDYSGMPASQLLGSGWAAMVHPDDLPSAAQRWADARVVGETYETEFRLRRADGSYRWHLARAVPLRDACGTITRWIGTNTDIDEQKATSAALAHLNQTLESQVAERTAERDRIWRLSRDLMLIAEFDGTMRSVNPAWTAMLGWTQAELLGRPFLEFIHPDDREATLSEMSRLALGATTFRFENRYRCKDETYRWLNWTAVPDDRFVHAVARDVTTERTAAEALRRSEAALYQAQKMESVGQLTGGVAHDFNNLLQVIAGNLHLLTRTVAGNEKSERFVANAMAGVRRGAKLSSQLLAFARRQPLEPKTVNVGRLVRGMEEMLRRTIGESVEVETVVSGSLWNCFVDPDQVENALLNLALNARDAMDGVGRLTVEAGNALLDETYALRHPDVTAGQYVMLAVTDTGCGIEPDILAKVFEPFFSTKPEGKGTGLGLSMVFGFVKQSGGHVKMYSEPGHGTTVKLYLPRVASAEDPQDTKAVSEAPAGTETILVAEDDQEVRETVVEMLAQMGYRVLSARDAASALSIVESGEHIDLLFTDVVMPGSVRSTELARLAKERLPQIAVLFTSGYTRNAIVHGGRLDPGVELLGKPYTQDALAKKIREVLASHA